MRKIQRFRSGLNPLTREPEASMLTTRPPKPSIKDCIRGFTFECYLRERPVKDVVLILLNYITTQLHSTFTEISHWEVQMEH
jgi:hypothetical protein